MLFLVRSHLFLTPNLLPVPVLFLVRSHLLLTQNLLPVPVLFLVRSHLLLTQNLLPVPVLFLVRSHLLLTQNCLPVPVLFLSPHCPEWHRFQALQLQVPLIQHHLKQSFQQHVPLRQRPHRTPAQ